MKELSSETGVPDKFELVHAEPSSNPSKLESQVHQALRSSNFSKEFFDVSPTEAIRTVQKVSEQIELVNKEKIRKQVNASPQIKKYFGEISSQKQNLQFSKFSKTEPRNI